MVRRTRRAGVFGGLAIAAAAWSLAPAWAQDRAPPASTRGPVAEFQSQVGDRVFFGDSSADLGARGRVALEAQAAWLARHPSLSVLIEGHADDAGAPSYNLEMSERRAETVRHRLVQMGVASSRIRTVAYGRQRVVADCTAPACAAQNRRAVTVIVSTLSDRAEAPAAAPREPAARRSPRRMN